MKRSNRIFRALGLGILGSIIVLSGLSCSRGNQTENSGVASTKEPESSANPCSFKNFDEMNKIEYRLWFGNEQVLGSSVETGVPYARLTKPFISGNEKAKYFGSAMAGKPLCLSWSKTLERIGGSGNLTELEIHYRIDQGDEIVVNANIEENSGRTFGLYLIDIPSDAKDTFEVWFKAKNEQGQEFWDSNFGKNFLAGIIPQEASELSFNAPNGDGWPTPIPSMFLSSKKGVTISYDMGRMDALGLDAGWYRVGPTRFVTGYITFQDVSGNDLSVIEIGIPNDYGKVPRTIKIPTSAKKMIIYFEGHNIGRSDVFDSNFGSNFVYTID